MNLMNSHNKKPDSISVSLLRDKLFHAIMEELNPLVVDKKTGNVSVVSSKLTDKERWNLLKRIDRHSINARGNPVARVRVS